MEENPSTTAGGTESSDSNEGERKKEADNTSVIDSILDSDRETVFANKQLVDPSTIVDHDRIYGRDEQLAAQARAFRDTLEGERPPDLLLYGPSGTGKTLTVKAVAEKVKRRARERDISFEYVTTNFKSMESHTLDRAVWKLGNEVARKSGVAWTVPQKGISTDAKYTRLYNLINDHFDAIVFILDEIDALTGRHDKDEPAYSRLLYSLSRAMNEQRIETLVSTVIITNHPKFREDIDSRVESSYRPTAIHFPDYDANELNEILDRRRDAFKDGALAEGVIPKVSAYAAQNEGDARRAIDLLHDAGELADNNGDATVTEQHVELANDVIAKNYVLEIVSGMAVQKKLALFAAAIVADVNNGTAPSPVVYKLYENLCERLGTTVYTKETINSHIGKAETYGVLDSERTSQGYKGGVHIAYRFTESVEAVIETLRENSDLSDVELSTVREIARTHLQNI